MVTMEEEQQQDQISACSDDSLATTPNVGVDDKESTTYCIHHPWFWYRIREDIINLREVLIRENEARKMRRNRRKKRSSAEAFEENGDENTNKKSKKNEDDSIDKTTNNKEDEIIYSYDEDDDVLVLEDAESNKKTSCFDHDDWTIDLTDSYKPCELCLLDEPEE